MRTRFLLVFGFNFLQIRISKNKSNLFAKRGLLQTSQPSLSVHDRTDLRSLTEYFVITNTVNKEVHKTVFHSAGGAIFSLFRLSYAQNPVFGSIPMLVIRNFAGRFAAQIFFLIRIFDNFRSLIRNFPTPTPYPPVPTGLGVFCGNSISQAFWARQSGFGHPRHVRLCLPLVYEGL